MKTTLYLFLSFFFLGGTVFISGQSKEDYKIHDETRPQPTVVSHSSFSRMATAPSDAIILFDGKDLSEWVSSNDGAKAKWTVRDNYFEVKKKTGGIRTVKEFGDVQLHIEWASPKIIEGKSQQRGNSGVFFMVKPNY